MTMIDMPAFDVHDPQQAAEALPFLMGFRPDNSMVAFIYDETNERPHGTARRDIPADPAEWNECAGQFFHTVLHLMGHPDGTANSLLLYLSPDPAAAANGYAAMRRYEPLAARLTEAATQHRVATLGTLFVTTTHWWAYDHPEPMYCRSEGMPAHSPDFPGPITTAAALGGIPMPPSLAEVHAQITPITGPLADAQTRSLDRAATRWNERIGSNSLHAEDQSFTTLLDTLLLDGGDGSPLADLDTDLAADLITGLQWRHLRDLAMEFTRPAELRRAHDLWTLLARRCTTPDGEIAAPLLTLAGYTAWASADTAIAVITLRRARQADPYYQLAELLLAMITKGLPLDRILATTQRQRALRLGRLD
ncbi:DUF4192 domain-containing protein [Kitasatospora sp. NBC_01560]|uniref:DUF4192 domain-containing protein n=1 Tax=Kitasatospora sp. NBC_01560 TaxID=2975965 RepID=UPI0038637A0D